MRTGFAAPPRRPGTHQPPLVTRCGMSEGLRPGGGGLGHSGLGGAGATRNAGTGAVRASRAACANLHGVRVALARILGHAFGDDGVECSRQPWSGEGRPRGRTGEVVADLLLQAVAGERVLRRQALVQHTRQRVDIRTGVDSRRACPFAREPLRRHVEEGPDHIPGSCQRLLACRTGDSEIDQVGVVIVVDQNVGRLDVAVQQSSLVRCLQCPRYVFDVAHRACRRQRTGVQHRLQIGAIDQPHINEQSPADFAVGVNRHHMRTVQSRSSVGLTPEPLLEDRVSGNLGRQNLDRDDPVDDGVVGTPHLAHPASPEQLDQPVVSERLSLQRAPPAAPSVHCHGCTSTYGGSQTHATNAVGRRPDFFRVVTGYRQQRNRACSYTPPQEPWQEHN